MKVKQSDSGVEGNYRVPKNLSLKKRLSKKKNYDYDNSFSKAKKRNFEKYTSALEEAVDYLLGIGDYRKLTNEARRIVMFLLSTRKAWTFTERLVHKKNPEEILKFLNAELIPKFRKQIILDFLEKPVRRPFQDWELKIIEDLTLSNTQAMYNTGRTYESIRSHRMHQKILKRKVRDTDEVFKVNKK